MKKLLSAILAAVMLFSLVTVGATTAWADTPAQDGKVFAGYYVSDAYTSPSDTETEYPKFVDENVLTAKYQLSASANEDEAKIKIRVVTTVDSLQYKAIGFHVWKNGTQLDVGGRKFETTKVAKTIQGTDGLGVFTYEPTVFSAESVYFCAYNFGLNAADYSAELTFQPYWITLDGTEVTANDTAEYPDGKRTIVISQSESFNSILIGSASELLDFATASQSKNFAGWKVKLTDDIDLNPDWTASASAPANTWTSIGSQSVPFAGLFDGQGHTISGVYLSTTTARQGLFGETASTAVLKDFNLTNSYFTTSTFRLGSIVGTFAGTAEHIYSDALVNATGGNRIGGLFGVAAGATISQCWYGGTVSAPSLTYVGGMIGSAQDAVVTLEHSLFTGSVTSTNQVGGLIGYAATTTTIDDCASIGAVAAGKVANAGLLVGQKADAATLNISDTVYGNNRATTAYTRIGYSGSATSESNLSALADQAAITALVGMDSIIAVGDCLDFAENWAIRADAAPVPAYFGGEATYTVDDEATLSTLVAASRKFNFANWSVLLDADIDLNEGWDASTAAAPANEWAPIGSQSVPFAGTFDGQGHTVSGLYLSATTAQQGFFAATSADATIRDFRLENSYLTTNAARMGSIVGNFAGTAERIYSNAYVRNTNTNVVRHGGLFGMIYGAATISECWYDGELPCSGTNDVGGIVGHVLNSGEAVTIQHTLFSGSITAKSNVGGLVGSIGNTSGVVTIYDCASLGTISSSQAANCGEVVGKIESADNVVYSYTAYGNEHETSTKRVVGTSYTSKLTDNGNTRFLTTTKPSALYGLGGLNLLNNGTDPSVTAENWALKSDNVPVPIYFSEASEAKTYVVSNAAELRALATASQSNNLAGWTVKLTEDIDLNPGWTANAEGGTGTTPTAWTPIGSQSVPFAGTFDGQGHTVSGVYLTATTARQGFFAETAATAVVRDFRLTNSYLTSSAVRLGSVVGSFKGTAERIYSNAFVKATGGNAIGGLFGRFDGNATVSECWYDGAVTAAGISYVGGFVGTIQNAGTVRFEHSLFSGTVSASNQVGGLIGIAISASGGVTINDCASLGTVSGSSDKGMVVGKNSTALTFTHTYGADGVNTGLSLVGTQSGTYNYTTTVRSSSLSSALTGLGGTKPLNGNSLLVDQWRLRTGGVPVPKYFGEADSNVYTINDAADLRLFADMSQNNSFAGWTIKLGDDIDLNPGWTADANGGTGAAPTAWTPIGTTSVAFAGTFDGQGHTVSGLYMEIDAAVNGMFRKTAATAVLKNFRLENSLLNVTAGNRVGSIVGDGYGAIYNVYSSAIINGRGWTGGLVGFATNLTMEQCQFDGVYTNTTANGSGVAGLIGYVNGGNTVLRNCLNSGRVNSESYVENNQPKVGGLVGQVASNGILTIENCLNTGLVSTVKTYTFGRILGYNDTGCSTAVIGSYATQESCASADANGRPKTLEYELVTEAGITGAAAQTAMPLLDWVNVWQTVDGDLPTLRFDEASIGGSSLNGEATSADTAQLSAVYGGTSLYQGDMHAHADADGEIDETAALAQWKTEMAGHDLDFVASLDHRQTNHIENSEWDKDLFLYGTEPGTYISGLTSPTYSATKGKAHYLMLFKDRDSLLNVVQNGTFGFNYDASKDNDSATPTSGAYDYPGFTKSEFAALAAEVKAQGGLFVFAHPYAYSYSSAAEDYFIADGTALELIYTGMSTDETLQAYSTWEALLAAGHKVWVSSGTDIHGGLDTQSDYDSNPRRCEKALISVYAVTDTELTNKADLVMDELVRGNFAAGSVGIKMCIGSTPMGGTADFAGKRLVVEVSGFHSYVKDTAHKYYVRVVTDQGAVYTQRVSSVNSATTFALDADESCRFYRVEVVDEQGGRVISYGNPIWND